MNLEFIYKKARLHSQGVCNGGECLYKIGFAAGLLRKADINQASFNYLSSHLRSILTWLCRNANSIGLTQKLP